jgi:hypothetical protein
MGPIAVKPFLLCALLSGALFGAGLVVSGMTDPERVIGFLDIFGHFDPRLGFVFVEAVLVTIVTFRVALRMPKPLAAPRFELPSARQIDRQLLVGATIFGIGVGHRWLLPWTCGCGSRGRQFGSHVVRGRDVGGFEHFPLGGSPRETARLHTDCLNARTSLIDTVTQPQ